MLTLFNSTDITRGQISSPFYRFKNELVENRNTLNIGKILLNDLAIPLLLVNPREMSAYICEKKKYTRIFTEALSQPQTGNEPNVH